MLLRLLAILSAVALTASTAAADITANKDIVRNMMADVFAARDASAVDQYFAEDYIQRNPMIPSGSGPIKALMAELAASGAPAAPPTEVHRVIAEGDLVATHSTLYGFGPTPLVAFDVFRIENGKIVEHWDVIAPIQTKDLPDGYPGKF